MFRRGQKVVCIDNVQVGPFGPVRKTLEIGEIYTVTDIVEPSRDAIGKYANTLCITVSEVENPYCDSGEFGIERFRPLVTTDISIFEQMLVDPPKQELEA